MLRVIIIHAHTNDSMQFEVWVDEVVLDDMFSSIPTVVATRKQCTFESHAPRCYHDELRQTNQTRWQKYSEKCQLTVYQSRFWCSFGWKMMAFWLQIWTAGSQYLCLWPSCVQSLLDVCTQVTAWTNLWAGKQPHHSNLWSTGSVSHRITQTSLGQYYWECYLSNDTRHMSESQTICDLCGLQLVHAVLAKSIEIWGVRFQQKKIRPIHQLLHSCTIR